MAEYENIVTLSDADGSEMDFELLDVVPFEGRDYAVLLPVDEAGEEAEAAVLEILRSGEEEDVLRGVDDPAILEAVFVLFKERNKADFNLQ